MSWDVLLIRTKTNREAMDEIKSENIILFSQAEIAREIGKIATELGAVCDCQDCWEKCGDGVGYAAYQRQRTEGGVYPSAR